jgi:hypothetical protein
MTAAVANILISGDFPALNQTRVSSITGMIRVVFSW